MRTLRNPLAAFACMWLLPTMFMGEASGLAPASAAQAPGGFIESDDSSATRTPWTTSDIQRFLPPTGTFAFPAPYNTEGIRLTNARDCGGGDCVIPIASSYGRNINNHRGRDTILVFLGLRGVGPTLFGFSKATEKVRNLGPLFDSSSPYASASGEGWYFSGTQPSKLYVTRPSSAQLQRYDVFTKSFETVFDASTQFGAGTYVGQAQSSDDDNVHSATLVDSASHTKLGCLAYREDARQYFYYPAAEDYSECQIDKSGRWLVIKEDLDGVPGRDNLIVDLGSGAETVISGGEGAGGRSDNGYGYMVAADSRKDLPGAAVRVWDFDQSPLPGPVVYHTPGGVEPITHSNAVPGVPRSQQYACAANATMAVAPRANEIVCFRLDGSPDVLVVTQTMTHLSARLGDPSPKLPTGNLDVTGGYFIWVSNMGGNRADAFMVKVPAQRLMGAPLGAKPPADPNAGAAPGSSLKGPTASPLAAKAASLPAAMSPLAVTPPAGTVEVHTPALFNPSQGLVSLINSSQDLPPVGAYTTYAATAPAQGQWVMGDWDGNGIQTPAVYGDNGAFYYTNDIGPTTNWTGIWFGLLGHPPVAGRFDAAVRHDCLGVVDSTPAPGFGTAFALYFTCDLTSGPNPPKVVQWLGAPLPDSAGFTGVHQFAAGDFDRDGVDSLAVRRGPYIAWTNVPPMTLSAGFDLAQYVGAPGVGYGNVVAGDWDGNTLDSFGLFYPDGSFYRRDDLEWNSGLYTLQRVGQPIGTPVTASRAKKRSDVTPPLISAVLASAVTTSGATISWTTNEPSNTQVQYGTTTAYGSLSTLNASPLTAHLVTLGGLAPNALYHYRVKSRDAADNLATSADFTFTTLDGTPPSVSITAPAGGASVSAMVTVTAGATDNVAVVGVQFKLDGANLGAEDTASPYSVSWNTTTAANGSHILTAVARDAASNVTTSAGVTVTVSNGAIVTLTPDDTFLNLDAVNYGTSTQLTTYTWPANQAANAILMKFDLSTIPAGALPTDATLQLALVSSDTAPETTYTVTAHKIVGKNPVIAAATGYTADGVVPWTANACCFSGVPLAQADISAAYDTEAIDKTAGTKSWTITTMVQEWLAAPATNFGLLLNADTSKLADRYRTFASMENATPSLRPSLRITYTIPPPDPTPPTVSITAPVGGATVSATVTVTASATDNVAVVGVLFKLDGANLGAEDMASPYSMSWNTTGAANGSHTLTAVARDAAGNSTTSASVTVTVANDTTPPSVSITAPAGGATVSATVTVTASASDNVAVVGVQFKLDGANLGAEDTTASPYSVSWNTTGVANGSHTLTAVARDAASNQTTSAAVTVTVSNTGVGIAALYPGDVGIESHPDVVFVERFDEPALTDVFSRWSDILNGSGMSFSSDVPPGSPGPHSLNIPWVGGGVNNGGHLYKQLSLGVNDTLYVRFYIKYPTSGNSTHTGIWMGGHNPPVAWPDPQAGIKPAGNDRFSASAEQNDVSFDHYDYWMNMRQSLDLNYWGNRLLNDPSVQARTGQWKCVEQMVKLNNPVTSFNGEHAIWLDGVKVSHLGQGFPNGTWTGGIFTQAPTGSPFEGFRWRSDANLNLNWIWLQNYSPNDPPGFSANMYFDHVVVAKSYIGCLASGSPDPTPPTVSLAAPAAGSTVSGAAVTVSANASDNIGVVGVQFKLDAANLGAEDTTAPYSIFWNTTTVANGAHTLTAVARDAAGNTTTAAGVTVTVSNLLGSWPNEPVGLVLRSDWALDQVVPTSGDVPISGSLGWNVVGNAPAGSARGWTARVSDPSAPFSAPNVYDFVYPLGMVEGEAPSTVYYAGLGATEIYAGFWWKPSSPFDYGPNGNKVAFIFNGGGGAGGQQFMILLPDGRLHVLPEYPGDFRWRTPNVNATFVTLGVWHRIEWYTNRTTGTLKWWLDGVLQGSYTDVRNSFNFDMFQFSPTWGGNIGATKRETDHYWFDHVHLSAR